MSSFPPLNTIPYDDLWQSTKNITQSISGKVPSLTAMETNMEATYKELLQSNTLSPTALSVVIFLFVALVPFTAAMVYRYADRKTPLLYLIFVFVGWYSGFAGTLLLPIDIANTYATGASATSTSPLTFVWKVVSYLTVLFAWVLTPFVMEFRAAGGFTWFSKMRYSVKSNCVSYVVITAIVIVCVVLIVALRLSYKTLMPLLTAAGNIYGLCFIVVLMSYGLVEIPRTLWSMCKGPRTLLRRLEYAATAREEELFDAITAFSSIVGRLRAIEPSFDDDGEETSDVTLDNAFQTIRGVADQTLLEISTASQWSSSISLDRDSRNNGNSVGDDSSDAPPLQWDDDSISRQRRVEMLEKLHAAMKTTGHRVRVAIAMWKRLLLDAQRLQNHLNSDQKNGGGDRELDSDSTHAPLAPPMWGRKRMYSIYREYVLPATGKTLSVFFALLSIAILWCEVSMGSFSVPLSPFGRIVSLVPRQESAQLATLVLTLLPFLYMSLCTCVFFFFSVFWCVPPSRTHCRVPYFHSSVIDLFCFSVFLLFGALTCTADD